MDLLKEMQQMVVIIEDAPRQLGEDARIHEEERDERDEPQHGQLAKESLEHHAVVSVHRVLCTVLGLLEEEREHDEREHEHQRHLVVVRVGVGAAENVGIFAVGAVTVSRPGMSGMSASSHRRAMAMAVGPMCVRDACVAMAGAMARGRPVAAERQRVPTPCRGVRRIAVRCSALVRALILVTATSSQ